MRDLSEVLNKVLLGRCEDVLREIPDHSVDCVLTDSPYGIGNKEPSAEAIDAFLAGASLDTGGDFLGADWQIPPVGVWKECIRVVKPGGYVASFAGTRTFDLFDAAMRVAGLTDEDTFMSKFGSPIFAWIHSQGFPKNRCIFADLEKMGEHDLALKYKSYGTTLKPSWEPILIFRTPGPRFHHAETDVPFFYSAKVSKREANLKDEVEQIENSHPTKKGVKLLKHLLELTTPQGGTVLDMYCGSGSTLHAAQELGMNFIGIEMDPVFHKIASDRTRIIGERLERDRAKMTQELLNQAQEEGPSAIENALFDLAMSDE